MTAFLPWPTSTCNDIKPSDQFLRDKIIQLRICGFFAGAGNSRVESEIVSLVALLFSFQPSDGHTIILHLDCAASRRTSTHGLIPP